MTFKFECPFCGQRISATTEDVGTIGICPACRIEFKVPVPRLAPGELATVSGRNRRGGLMLALVALALCLMPWLCLTVLRSIRVVVSEVQAGALLVLVAVLCTAGLVAGHRAWRRAVGQRTARVISVLSLVVGCFSMLAMALVVGAVLVGSFVIFKQYKEPPDFMPFEASEPAPKSAPRGPAER